MQIAGTAFDLAASRTAAGIHCKIDLGPWSDSAPPLDMSAHHIDDDFEPYTESLPTPSPTWSLSDPIGEYGFEYNNQLHYYEDFGYPEFEGLRWGGSTSEQNSQVGVEEVATSAMESPSMNHAPTGMQPPISITIDDKGVQVSSDYYLPWVRALNNSTRHIRNRATITQKRAFRQVSRMHLRQPGRNFVHVTSAASALLRSLKEEVTRK